MRSFLGISITILCLMAAPLQSHAADKSKTKTAHSAKERLVLMPIRVPEEDKNLTGAMETALVEGLQLKYDVFSGERVAQKAHEIFMKESRNTAHTECDETRCMQNIAEAFQAELIATANVTKQDGSYFLAMSIQNIFDNKVVYSKSLPCEKCSQIQVIGQLKILSGVVFPELTQEPILDVNQIQKAGSVFKDCEDCPEMVVVPTGSFNMGSSSPELVGTSMQDFKSPAHKVNLEQFAMGKTEVTVGQFAAFVKATNFDAGTNCFISNGLKWEQQSGANWRKPGYKQNKAHPVTCINWNDAKSYVKWLSRKTGKAYQLPSESQWEYACRAGGQNEYCGSDNLDSIAWYGRKNGESTHPVAAKQANDFGVFDMSGNVWEWVEDNWHANYNNAPADGTAWQGDDEHRVIRGGSWDLLPSILRADFRLMTGPFLRSSNIGFRIVRVLP